MKKDLCIPRSIVSQRWQTIFSVVYCDRGKGVFLKISLPAGKSKIFIKKFGKKCHTF